MKVHDTRSHAHASEEQGRMATRKQKAESKAHEAEAKNKKPKPADAENGKTVGQDVMKDFEEFCKATREHLPVEDTRKLLQANGVEASGADNEVMARCQDMLFFGPLRKCPVCKSQLNYEGIHYACQGKYSEWTTCSYTTRESVRNPEPIKVPEGVGSPSVLEWVKKHEQSGYPQRELKPLDKPFAGMMIALSGRLSRTHHFWREEIEKHGGKVSNTISGIACLVVSPAERERGGSSKVVEAMERNIPVVREAWLVDSIIKQAAQPLDAYDIVGDLSVEGKGIPWEKMDPSEEALESLSAEVKLYGKRGVYKDSKLQDDGGRILEKDGLLFNCAFSLCDQWRGLNEYCVMQLITMPDGRLYLFYQKGRVGDESRAEERVEERNDVDAAVKEFACLFEDITGNPFEPWEREKKFEKKFLKFYPLDMDDGVDVRYGGLGLRQMGAAAAHCKLDPLVANFMKVLCSQEIYKYALLEYGLDAPNLPIGMLTSLHLKRCEEILSEFIEMSKKMPEMEEKARMMWLDFSNRWFTLMHSTRPFTIRNYGELADHVAAALECVRDTAVASHIVGDMTGATVDDPLSERYKKLGCSVAPLSKESSDYKLILDYVDRTYEPVVHGEVSYGVSVENIFAVKTTAGPAYEDVKRLPNKMLLWCGTRSSNLMRHLHKGFLPAICSLPVPGYMFGRSIVCSDAAAEAARYGFTAVDRPEGFLVLAVVSLGEKHLEVSTVPEDTKSLEEKGEGVKGLGRKKTDEAEHITWDDDVKVPCGRLVPSEHRDSPLEFNEYAVYDPNQVCIRFLVGVKYEERNVEYVDAE